MIYINLELKNLKVLNISGIKLSSASCLKLGASLATTASLVDLSMSNCLLKGEQTRVILKGIELNVATIQNINLTSNDLSSLSYEHASQLAKIIARHKSLTHLNLENTKLKVIIVVNSIERRTSLHLFVSAIFKIAVVIAFVKCFSNRHNMSERSCASIFLRF